MKSYTYDLEEGIKEISAINLENPIYSMDTSENYHICALDTRQIKVCCGSDIHNAPVPSNKSTSGGIFGDALYSLRMLV